MSLVSILLIVLLVLMLGGGGGYYYGGGYPHAFGGGLGLVVVALVVLGTRIVSRPRLIQ